MILTTFNHDVNYEVRQSHTFSKNGLKTSGEAL